MFGLFKKKHQFKCACGGSFKSADMPATCTACSAKVNQCECCRGKM